MSREATSVEATVTGLNLASDGTAWAQISFYEAEQNPGNAGSAPQVAGPSESYSIFIRAASLPGIQLGDKVQIALYLK
jgi:hypothetical protein